MAKNRYNGLLKRRNTDIVLVTANDPLKVYVAHELRNALGNKKERRVLEIGCGEGELTKHLLAYTKNTTIDLLDPSKSMLNACKKHFGIDRLSYLCGDITTFPLQQGYDAIVASQVIHNFVQEDKVLTFQRIFDLLKLGGVLIITDKVYPDDRSLRESMFEVQMRRYRDYLPEKAAQAIIDHEKQDMSDPYRMEETKTLTTLGNIGFKHIQLIDRIERDVVMKAIKR